MRLRDDEGGQVLVITAVCLVAFIGFIGLSVDVGTLFYAKRQMQTAADAAATAAALTYLHSDYADNFSGAIAAASAAGVAAATANDISFGSDLLATVRVNTNPISPTQHQNCSGSNCYFEAVVTKQNPTIFYSTFLSLWRRSGSGTITVAARAVAGTPGVSSACNFITAPTGNSLITSGNWSIYQPNCGMSINSDGTIPHKSNSVQDDTGKADKAGITAPSINLVAPAPNDLVLVDKDKTTVAQVLPETIPFSNLPAPDVPKTGCTTPKNGTLTGSVSPGCYSGNITIGGSGKMTTTLTGGLYVFTGDVTIGGSVSGTDVTLDVATGTFSVSPGNATVALSAPTTGTYNGIVYYQPASNTHPIGIQKGSTDTTLTGFIYAPGATLSLQDKGGSLTASGLVVNTINMGPSTLNVTGYSSSTSPLKVVSLVE